MTTKTASVVAAALTLTPVDSVDAPDYSGTSVLSMYHTRDGSKTYFVRLHNVNGKYHHSVCVMDWDMARDVAVKGGSAVSTVDGQTAIIDYKEADRKASDFAFQGGPSLPPALQTVPLNENSPVNA